MKTFLRLNRTFKKSFFLLQRQYSTVELYINGKKAVVPANTSIYDACKMVLPKYEVPPTLCHHPYVKPTGQCRVCLVQKGPQIQDTSAEVTLETPKDGFGMVPSCATPVSQGMNIWTNTEHVRRNIEDVLKLLLSNHPLECPTCPANLNCEFQDLLAKYNITPKDLDPVGLEYYNEKLAKANWRKQTNQIESALDNFQVFGSNAIHLDRDKCIRCTRCIRICEEVQGMCVLGMAGRNRDERVSSFAPDENFELTECISCGQCSYVCPVGAITVRSNLKEVRDLLKNKRRPDGTYNVLVAQTAPAVRVAISEGFGFEPGYLSDKQMVIRFTI